MGCAEQIFTEQYGVTKILQQFFLSFKSLTTLCSVLLSEWLANVALDQIVLLGNETNSDAFFV